MKTIATRENTMSIIMTREEIEAMASLMNAVKTAYTDKKLWNELGKMLRISLYSCDNELNINKEDIDAMFTFEDSSTINRSVERDPSDFIEDMMGAIKIIEALKKEIEE